jgi:HSP20 family protein
MGNVTVQKIREANQTLPLLPETSALLDEVRMRAFDFFKKRGGVSGDDMGDWLRAEREIFQVPSVELAENDNEFQLQLALPGFEVKDIRVAALPDSVIVEGESTHQHRETSGTVHFCEFGERRVFRQIPLPQPVDVDRASATLDKGLLRVRVAKAQDQGRRNTA